MVNKSFRGKEDTEPRVEAYVPMYEPLEVSKCEKCDRVIAEPKELIRIVRK